MGPNSITLIPSSHESAAEGATRLNIDVAREHFESLTVETPHATESYPDIALSSSFPSHSLETPPAWRMGGALEDGAAGGGAGRAVAEGANGGYTPGPEADLLGDGET